MAGAPEAAGVTSSAGRVDDRRRQEGISHCVLSYAPSLDLSHTQSISDHPRTDLSLSTQPVVLVDGRHPLAPCMLPPSLLRPHQLSQHPNGIYNCPSCTGHPSQISGSLSRPRYHSRGCTIVPRTVVAMASYHCRPCDHAIPWTTSGRGSRCPRYHTRYNIVHFQREIVSTCLLTDIVLPHSGQISACLSLQESWRAGSCECYLDQERHTNIVPRDPHHRH